MTDDTRDDRRPEAGDTEREIRDALDRAISDAMDDALPPAEQAALRERIAAEPEVAERVRAFQAVDEAIRDLAEADRAAAETSAVDAAGLADLQARIGGPARGGRSGRWAPAAALVAAAAAAILLWRAGEETTAHDPAGSTPVAGTELGEQLEEEVSVALGYGEEIEVLPDVPIEDFEVVDQLELLEFLAQREREGRG